MRILRRVISILTVVSSFALQSVTVAAQSTAPVDPKDVARELAKQGFARFNAGAYEEAISLYQQAYRTFKAPTILMHLADAHDKKGDLLTARLVYREVVDAPSSPTDPQAFIDAQQRARIAIAALDKRIPQLRIIIHGSTRPVQISVDGSALPSSSVGSMLEYNPGEHTVVATEQGGVTLRERIILHEGARTDVPLTFPQQPPKATPPVVSPPPAQTRRSPLPSTPVASTPPPPIDPKEPYGIATPASVAFITAALGTGTGLITGGLWLKNNNEIRAQCYGDYCPKRLEGDIDATKKLGVISLVSFSVAGAGLGLGLILLTTSSNEEVGVSLEPSSITLRGRF